MNTMKRELYVCRCHSLQHSFVISADEEDVFLEVHLATMPWTKRLGNALRYVFGGKSKWGDYEEILLSPGQAYELGKKLVTWSQTSTEH